MRRFLYTEKNCSFSDLLNFLFAFFVFSLNKIKQILYHCFCKAFSKNLPRNVLLLFLFSHLFFTEVNTPKPDNTSQYNVLNSTGFQDLVHTNNLHYGTNYSSRQFYASYSRFRIKISKEIDLLDGYY